jgi:hypothetical protein
VHARVHGGAGHFEIEVVGSGVLRRRVTGHRRAQRHAVLGVQPQKRETLPDVRREEGGDALRLQVGDRDPAHPGLLQQIVRAGRSLQSRAQHQYAHRSESPS